MGMNGAASAPGDLPPRVYALMAGVLRVGLVVSLVVLGVAAAVLVARSPASASGGWIATNPLVRYLDLRALAAGLAHGTPEAYLTVGVFALVATPVVRVVTGLYAFAAHGERRMAVLAAAVLGLLFVGLLVVGPLVR
jgi:uncharacterized membrane protein